MSQNAPTELSDTRDEAFWLQHKNILHHLYIKENKTLRQVKNSMEERYRFPVLSLHNYEVALRDILMFRKNLKREDWYVIGLQIADRKRQAKKSEIIWNNSALRPRKVRKEVLRNRNVNCISSRTKTNELPVGLLIKTPPASPIIEHRGSASMIRYSDRNLHRNPIVSEESSCVKTPSVLRHPDSDIQITSPEATGSDTSRFRRLREDIPFNRFISEVLGLSKDYISYLINCLLPSILISDDALATSYPTSIIAPAWLVQNPTPRLFGYNPSLDMLARVTFDLSNKLYIDWTAESSWFLTWLGASADIGMLRAFFSIKTPTVCAVYERLCTEVRSLKRPAPARILFEVQDSVRKTNELIGYNTQLLHTAVEIGSIAEGMLEVAQRALSQILPPVGKPSGKTALQLKSLFMVAAAQRDIAMLRLLLGAVMDLDCTTDFRGDAATRLLSLIVRQIYALVPTDHGVDDKALRDYIDLLIPGGVLTICPSPQCCYDDRPPTPIKNVESLTIDELVMICPAGKRRRLYSVVLRWSEQHNISISKAGIYTASLEGTEGLRQYLQSFMHRHDFDTQVTMQECLLYAAILNDTSTAAALLELGTSPKVSLLWNNKERYRKGGISWNPMIVAAAAGNLETLELFRDRIDLASFVELAPVYEIVQLEDAQHKYGVARGREVSRLENLQRHYLYTETQISDAALARGNAYLEPFRYGDGFLPPEAKRGATDVAFFLVKKNRIDTLSWIRNIAVSLGTSQLLDVEIFNAAVCNNKARAMRRHMTTYHPCDVLLLEGLVDANLQYHEGDMDLLHVCIRNQCRLEVVEFLLSKGLRVHSRAAAMSGNTMLHDALLSQSCDRSHIVDLLLREGADFRRCGDGLTILEASLQGKDFVRAPGPFLDYLDVFTLLFEAGAPVKHRPRPHLKEWQPLICRLVDAGAEDELILRVLDSGPELNERGRSCDPITGRMTPLESVISHKRERLARELIRRGANVHQAAGDAFNSTALQAACRFNCSLQFIEHLVKAHGTDVNEAPSQQCGTTALQNAASCGSLSLAEFLLEQGADINALSGRFELAWSYGPLRALDFAVMGGRLDMVEFLLKAGGRSGTWGLDGPIHVSYHFEHFGVLSILLDWGRKEGMGDSLKRIRQRIRATSGHGSLAFRTVERPGT